MKILTYLLMTLVLSFNIQAHSMFELSKFIVESKNFIDEMSGDEIGKINSQKLTEIKATLAQLKAEPVQNKSYVKEVNALYASINKILLNTSPIINDKAQVGTISATDSAVISGIVYDALTGDPLYEPYIRLYDIQGNYIKSSSADEFGRYNFLNLSAGQYVLIAYKTGYVVTAQPNFSCVGGLGMGCQIEDLTAINLTENQVMQQVNFFLESSPIISGTITDRIDVNNKIGSARISLYDAMGVFIKSVYSISYGDKLGSYEISAPNAGDYYLTVEHSEYQTQMFDDVTCQNNCDFNNGFLISVNANQELTGINFKLDVSSSISGTLLDSGTSQTLTEGVVSLYDTSENYVMYADIQQDGSWKMDNVPMGDYKIISYSSGYLATLFNQIACSTYTRCDTVFSSGDTISHTNNNTENIVLKQVKGASISGQVVDQQGLPIAYVNLSFYNSNFESIYSTNTDGNGYFETKALNNGDYYIFAQNSNYQSELYPNIFCEYGSCDFSLATPVSINNLSSIQNINIVLNPFASIAGNVSENQVPLSNAFVYLRGVSNNTSKYSRTNGNGDYVFDNLVADTYEVYTRALGYETEIYDGIKCDDRYCMDENNIPLNVLDNQLTGIDFTLNKLPTISFTLTSNSSNPVSGGYIRAYDVSGNYVTSSYRPYEIGLENGDYYLLFFSFNDFVSKVYGGVNCITNCDPTTGTLIHVTNNNNQSLNMNLDEYFYLDFVSTIGSAYHDLYDQDLTSNSFISVHDGSRIHIKEGNKFSKLSKSYYYNKIYNGIDCYYLDCDISQGTLISPQLNSSIVINIDDMINVSESISGVITDSAGQPQANVRVELLTDLTRSNIMFTKTNNLGEYTFLNIPKSNYYIKALPDYTTTNSAYTFYGNIACSTDCTGLNIPTVRLQIGENLTGIDIQLGVLGSISGEAIFNAAGQYISSQVKFYKKGPYSTSSYELINIAAVNTDGTIDATYLPEGSYKLIVGNQYYNPNFPSLNSAFPSFPCNDLSDIECASIADSIVVINGQDSHFNGLVVHELGKIHGVVSDSITGQPIEDARVYFYDANNNFTIYKSFTNANGEYSFGLYNGNYYIYVDTPYSYRVGKYYINQLYDNIDCALGIGLDCLMQQGQEITVINDLNTQINFNLKERPKLKIGLKDRITGKNLSQAGIHVFDNYLNEISIPYQTWRNNEFLIKTLLPNTQYFIMADMGAIYGITGYPDIRCADDSSVLSCESSLLPVVLTASENVKSIIIEPIMYQGINGFVRDGDTGESLANIIIDIWDSKGNIQASTRTSLTGGFSYALPVGDYYISTDTNNDYIDEVYNDVECDSAAIFGLCDIYQGDINSLPSNNTSPIIIDINLNISDITFANGFE